MATPSHVSPAQARGDLPVLTIIRGVGALLVFFAHAFGLLLLTSDSANETLVRLTVSIGEGAVGCFFVLSGFVLVWVMRPGETRRDFWRRRIARIGPNHLVTWAIGLALMVIFARGFNILALLPSLTLTHVWLPHPAVLEGTNPPAWSLACEAFFYACFPFLAARLLRRSDRTILRAAWGVGAAIVGWTLLVALLVPTEPRAEHGLPVPVAQMYALVFIPPVRLLDFALGMLLAEIICRGLWRPTSLRPGLVAVGAGWAASLLIPPPLGYVATWLPAIVLLIGAGATPLVAPRSAARARVRRTLIWMGEISFAFYLTHWLVLTYAKLPLGLERGEETGVVVVAYVAACLIVTLAAAELLRRWVEVPAARLLRPRERHTGEVDPLRSLAASIATAAGNAAATLPPPAPAIAVRAADRALADRASSDGPFEDRAETPA